MLIFKMIEMKMISPLKKNFWHVNMLVKLQLQKIRRSNLRREESKEQKMSYVEMEWSNYLGFKYQKQTLSKAA